MLFPICQGPRGQLRFDPRSSVSARRGAGPFSSSVDESRELQTAAFRRGAAGNWELKTFDQAKVPSPFPALLALPATLSSPLPNKQSLAAMSAPAPASAGKPKKAAAAPRKPADHPTYIVCGPLLLTWEGEGGGAGPS